MESMCKIQLILHIKKNLFFFWWQICKMQNVVANVREETSYYSTQRELIGTCDISIAIVAIVSQQSSAKVL